jgi:uncharacterized protein (DUF2267 family)
MARADGSDFIIAGREAQAWVCELADELHWDEIRAYRLLRSVLHSLRDGLSAKDTATLAGHLPLAIRGLLFDEWRPSDTQTQLQSHLEIGIPNDLAEDCDVGVGTAISAAVNLIDRHLSQARRVN